MIRFAWNRKKTEVAVSDGSHPIETKEVVGATLKSSVLQEIGGRFVAHLLQRRRRVVHAVATERPVGTARRHVAGHQRQMVHVHRDAVDLEDVAHFLLDPPIEPMFRPVRMSYFPVKVYKESLTWCQDWPGRVIAMCAKQKSDETRQSLP